MVAAGHLITGHFFLNPKEKRGIAGLTASEFMDIFNERRNGETSQHDFVAGPSYDSIWSLALALNNTMDLMRKKGNVTVKLSVMLT